jgi:two-component system sensor histidine kinase/response regulator
MKQRELPTTNFKILLVDDREENLISLEDILEQEGRVFVKATSGNDALKAVLRHDDIGLIMLDVQMPGMDGFEVAQLLKSNPKTKDISIIFVTAINKEEQYILRGFEQGAVDYLQKPLDINITKAKVNVFEQLYFYQQNLKNTSAELTRINKQLEQFVYIVAHDLKSPLSGIMGMLSIMNEEKDISDNNKLKEYIELLFLAANHLSEMITSILDYSKKSIDEQAVEEVDIHEMVSQISHLLFPPGNISVSINGTLPTLQTRKLKLQQVFQNLLSNAIKYNDKEKGIIEVGFEPRDDFFEFYIKDNGPGIAQEDEERIFRLFQTTSNTSSKDSSTGVGLNILKMLIEEQGGKIWVHSEPGNGSTFYFTWKNNEVMTPTTAL